MPEACLWQLILVSIDIEPGSDPPFSIFTGSDEYDTRFKISEACLRRGELRAVQFSGKNQNYDPAYTLIETMEFGSFAKRQGWPLPNRFPIDPVNWTKWGRADVVELWQAVAVATSHSPDGVMFKNAKASFGRDFEEMLEVAMSCLGSSLPIHSADDVTIFDSFGDDPLWPERRNKVHLPTFREWAEGKGYAVPSRFPRKTAAQQIETTVVAKDADTSPVEKAPIAASGVTVSLPHTTKYLDGVFKVMGEFWKAYDENNPPKQTAIARRLDEELGWRHSKDGGPSRSAQQIASMLRPDKLSEIDKRSIRRRDKS